MLGSAVDTSQANDREVVAGVAQLASRMELFLDDIRHYKRNVIMEEVGADLGMLSLNGKTREGEAFTLAQWDENQLQSLVNNSILNHLTYEMLPKRYEAVAEAHPNTFEWAFQISRAQVCQHGCRVKMDYSGSAESLALENQPS